MGDGVVEEGFELGAGSVLRDVDVFEVAVEAVVRESDQSGTDGHEPHLKMLKLSHLIKPILQNGFVGAIVLLWIRQGMTLRSLSVIRHVTNNDHHVIIVLIWFLPHVGQSILHSVLNVCISTPTTTRCSETLQYGSQLGEITCDLTSITVVIGEILVLNNLTHNCSSSIAIL